MLPHNVGTHLERWALLHSPRHRAAPFNNGSRSSTNSDDYYFEGPRTAQFVQIGNAVPVLMAKEIAAGIATELSQEDKDGKQSPT